MARIQRGARGHLGAAGQGASCIRPRYNGDRGHGDGSLERDPDVLLLKNCPRCRGDLLVRTFEGEQAATCLQCGFTRILSDARAPTQSR